MDDASWIAATSGRLDAICREALPSFTRSTLRDLFGQRCIRLNRRIAKPGDPVVAGDRIDIAYPRPSPTESDVTDPRPSPAESDVTGPRPSPAESDVTGPRPSNPMRLLFEGLGFAIFDKPSGLPCLPLRPWETQTAIHQAAAIVPELRALWGENEAGLLHRLDNETSGLLVFATQKERYNDLQKALRERRWRKGYLAWVAGDLPGSTTFSEPIGHDPNDPKRMILARDGARWRGRAQEARTWIWPITRATSPSRTLVFVEIETGVRHQIRLHLAAGGFPLLGDRLYNPSIASKDGRLMLHSCAIILPTPPLTTPFHLQTFPQDDFPLPAEVLKIGSFFDIVSSSFPPP